MASKRKMILDAVAVALEGITNTAGFTNDVQAVYRGLRFLEDLSPDKLPCLCLAGVKETRKNIGRPNFQADVRLTLIGYVSKSSNEDNLQEVLDSFIEDTTKALETDPTFGNTALWSEIQTIETDRGDVDKNGAFAMEISFNYASAGTQP